MDFAEVITSLAEKAQRIKGTVKTEEGTKNALVLP